MTEDEFLARLRALPLHPGARGLQDDAATLAGLVVTTDTLVEGVHFLTTDPPEDVAHKLLGQNLSDLAAKGADPLGFLLTLALPEGWTEPWLAGFARGLGELSDAAGCPLLGGDTVRAGGPLTVSVTAIGSVPAGRMVPRTTARAGDLLCVTGAIGDAVLGLDLTGPESPAWAGALRPDEAAYLVDRYRRPKARTAFAPALRDLARAAMDVSDGLVGDAAKLLRASGASGTLRLEAVPFSAPARAALAADPGLRDRLVTGGDDYEILFALPPERWKAAERAAAAVGLAVSVVGEVRDGDEPLSVLLDDAPHRLADTSFQHF